MLITVMIENQEEDEERLVDTEAGQGERYQRQLRTDGSKPLYGIILKTMSFVNQNQADRQTYTDRHKERQTYGHTDIDSQTHSDTQTDTQIETRTDTTINTQADRRTDYLRCTSKEEVLRLIHLHIHRLGQNRSDIIPGHFSFG